MPDRSDRLKTRILALVLLLAALAAHQPAVSESRLSPVR
jgi:hypothetical protein